MERRIIWCKPQPSAVEVPSQWYLNGEPCEVRSVGVEGGKVKHILVKTADNDLRRIESDGADFPGLTYEIMTH